MRRIGKVAVRLTLLMAIVLATCGQNSFFLVQASAQQKNASCSTTVQLTVNGTPSLDALYSSLDEAQKCATTDEASISVRWNGRVEVKKTITVPTDVKLRVWGENFLNEADDAIGFFSSSSYGSGGDAGSTAAMSSVIRGDGNVRLFTVEPDAQLYIYGMVLQNGWGGEYGGGGVYAAEGSTFIGETCFWNSLKATEAGGALAVVGAANASLRGTNVFSNCSSTESNGGAISVEDTTLTAHGSVWFEKCSASGKGGGLYTRTMSLLIVADGANISFVDNHAGDDGGGMFLSGTDEEVEEEDMITCFDLAKGSNAMFIGNSGGASGGVRSHGSGGIGYGGGVYFSTGCYVRIEGDVYFEQNAAVRAGAMYLDNAKVVVSGNATFVNNTAERWGGAVAVIGSYSGLEFTGPITARNNLAHRSGGVLYVEDARLVVNVSSGDEDIGALWEGNYAGYDGGVITVDGGEVHLEGGFACSNTAAQRGGVLFATGDSLLSWTAGESLDNSAVSGGSLFISNSEVNLTDVSLVGDHAPSDAVVFFADADARLINTSLIAPEELEGDFAVHVDTNSVLRAFSCSFEKWNGDNHVVLSEGILVLDACDFSQSSGATLFRAQKRSATIRNAILGNKNYASFGNNASAVFGLTASTCSFLSEEYSCLGNEQEKNCVDAEYGMGVLCTRYTAAATGAKVSLSGVGSSAELAASSTTSSSLSPLSPSLTGKAVYFPELVIAELTLRYSGNEGSDKRSQSWSSLEDVDVVGMDADAVLWELRFADGTDYGGLPTNNGRFSSTSSDNFSWVAMPISGVLMKDQEITVNFVGTPPPQFDPSRPSAVYNGEVSAAFHVLLRAAEVESTTVSSPAAFEATFYYCRVGAYWDGQQCALCVELMSAMADGDGSLECNIPGVTLETLPLAAGYWRGDVNRTIVQSCLLAAACKGGRGIVSHSSISTEHYLEDDRYCETGYVGPYCAICAKDFRRLSGYNCLDCQSDWGEAAHAVLWMATALAPVLLVSLIMYLVGGTNSFRQLRRKACGMCYLSEPAGVTQWSLREGVENDTITERKDEFEKGAAWKHMARAKTLCGLVLHAIPFQQIKIIVVVWQILTQYSDLAEIPYPPAYKRFLGILDAFNFDISWPLSAMCLVKEINFYEKLVIATLAPIIVLGTLGLSYAAAMRWHQGSDRNATESRQQVKVRHASVSLLVLFLVFSSVSTTIFSTFLCDEVDGLQVYLLRADYSISCYDNLHVLFQVYAGVMVLVYPVGIPLVFAFSLLKHRDKINPPTGADIGPTPRDIRTWTLSSRRGHVRTPDEPLETNVSLSRTSITSRSICRDQGASECAVRKAQVQMEPQEVKSRDDDGGGDGSDGSDRARTVDLERVNDEGYVSSQGPSVATDARCEDVRSRGARACFSTDRTGLGEGSEREGNNQSEGNDNAQQALYPKFVMVLRKRAQDLDLQPTKFLWEPYEPRIFYYETVECGRRCLLTGALVFVVPHTAVQMAGACILAFLSLLMFELIRPHISRADSWMYRIGSILIFFSNFLGLMVKADVSGQDVQSQELFSVLLIGVHVIIFVAIIFQVYLGIQLQLEESASNDDDDDKPARGRGVKKNSCELRNRRGSISEGVGDTGRNVQARSPVRSRRPRRSLGPQPDPTNKVGFNRNPMATYRPQGAPVRERISVAGSNPPAHQAFALTH